MNKKDWNEGLNNIDPALVEEHIEEMEKIAAKGKKDRTMWLRYATVAATVCIVFGAVVMSLVLNRADEPASIPETSEQTTEETNEETVAETVTTEEVTSAEETVEETETTAEVTSAEETIAETVTTAEVTSDEETVAETVTTAEVTSDEETVAETVTTAEVTSVEETVEETVTTAEVTSNEEITTEIGETTVIQETETTKSTNTEETSDIQETEETTVIQETESESESETETETESEAEELYEIKVDDYTLIKNENGCYLAFDDISKYQNNSSSGNSQVLGYIPFESIKDFKDTVVNGLLTDWQKEIVASFSTDSVDIPTCDFNNLYEPLFPQGGDIVEVGWKITSYYFMINNDNEYSGSISVLSYEEYEKQYTRDFKNALNGDKITIESVEIVDEKEITYYKTSLASLKRVRYTLQEGDRTVLVDKQFSLTNNSISQSSSIPYRITLYCVDGDRNYIVMLYSLQENPTDEWLLEFGLKPYIENDHEVM